MNPGVLVPHSILALLFHGPFFADFSKAVERGLKTLVFLVEFFFKSTELTLSFNVS